MPIEADGLKKPIRKQECDVLAFLGGPFTRVQRNRATYEEDDIAIVPMFKIMTYMSTGQSKLTNSQTT